jgi:hypothetical protein
MPTADALAARSPARRARRLHAVFVRQNSFERTINERVSHPVKAQRRFPLSPFQRVCGPHPPRKSVADAELEDFEDFKES